jgi:hypothetical protein
VVTAKFIREFTHRIFDETKSDRLLLSVIKKMVNDVAKEKGSDQTVQYGTVQCALQVDKGLRIVNDDGRKWVVRLL